MIFKVNKIHLNGTPKPLKLGREIEIPAGPNEDFRSDAAQYGIAAANPYSVSGLAAVAALVREHGTPELKALAKRLARAGY